MPCTRSALKTVAWFCTLSVVLRATFCKDVPYRFIKVPKGFNLDLYSDKIPGAQHLTVSRAQRPPASLAYVGSSASEVC